MNIHKIDQLRELWKPIATTAAASDEYELIRIRLHRCWSWLERVEELESAGVGAEDARLIYSWIGFNSLYGQWDEQLREPKPDRTSFQDFTSRLIHLDHESTIPNLLVEQRELVKSIAGDEFLSKYFWQLPGEETAKKAQNKSRQLGSLYHEKRYTSIADRILQHVYLARCQLVHGAATYGSRLNRDTVGRCADFLEPFVKNASLVIIQHAWQEDWGELCYPPIDNTH